MDNAIEAWATCLASDAFFSLVLVGNPAAAAVVEVFVPLAVSPLVPAGLVSAAQIPLGFYFSSHYPS